MRDDDSFDKGKLRGHGTIQSAAARGKRGDMERKNLGIIPTNAMLGSVSIQLISRI